MEISFYPTLDEKNTNQLNASCNNNFSKMVRAYKGLKNEMYKSKKYTHFVTSFMIECLLYNVSRTHYDISKYKNEGSVENKTKKMFLDIKANLFSNQLNLSNMDRIDTFTEINGKKMLFENQEHWKTVIVFFQDVNTHQKMNTILINR